MARYIELIAASGVRDFFCDPHNSWQQGSYGTGFMGVTGNAALGSNGGSSASTSEGVETIDISVTATMGWRK